MDESILSPVNWNFPTQIRFGSGRIEELGGVCWELGIKSPMLVTDSGMANLPITKQAMTTLENSELRASIYTDVKPNPTGSDIDNGLRQYRENRHDGVIAFGGGSGMDAGKAIGLMARQSRSLWDFEDVGNNWKRVDPSGIAPIIAVPTTAGTGSEVGRSSVILDEENQKKKIIFHPGMTPKIVISDPDLTMGLPPLLTASTGMDALSHCLEAYCAPGFHPMADGIALEGIRLIFKWLPEAVKNGTSLEARSNMLVAASMGATAFQKGLGAMHSLAHPIGAIYDSQHGLTNAVLMPYVLQYNRPAIEEKIARLASWLNLSPPTFDTVISEIHRLRADFDIPDTLVKMGLDDSKTDTIAEMAAMDPTAPTNPLPVGQPELKEIFLMALEGSQPGA